YRWIPTNLESHIGASALDEDEDEAQLGKLGRRQREVNPGSFAQGALGPDPPAVRLDDAPDDGQSQPHPVAVLALGLPGAVEQVGQLLRIHARAVIGDREADDGPVGAGVDADVPAGRAELHAVSDDV